MEELNQEIKITLEDVKEMFGPEHYGEPVPALDIATQLAIKQCFEENDIISISGSWPIKSPDMVSSGEVFSLGLTVSFNGHSKAQMEYYPDAFVGPYFRRDNGAYIPEATKIWINRDDMARGQVLGNSINLKVAS